MSSQARKDPTFTKYTAGQARKYAQHRPGYPLQLIQHILTHHEKTGGNFGTVLDIGCGPGNSARDLALYFEHVVGIDPSKEMTNAARSLGGTSKHGSPIEYITSDAEACEGVEWNSVDLLAAAMSAHWFDMERFWLTAARLMKPNGTVAFFNIYRMWCPPSMPHAQEVQRILLELDFETLKPYQMPGNVEVMTGYKGLQMPWMLAKKCTAFNEASFVRKVWNEDGKPEADGSYMCGEKLQTLEAVERAVGTTSAVTRWREAHPELAQTENDCVVSAFAKIRKVLGSGVLNITTVGPTVLLMLKRI